MLAGMLATDRRRRVGRAITVALLGVAVLLLPAAGTAVAQTVGSNVIDLRGQGELSYVLITLSPLCVVLLSLTFGIPTSMTLALVGAMLGGLLGRLLGFYQAGEGAGYIMATLVLGGGLLALIIVPSDPAIPWQSRARIVARSGPIPACDGGDQAFRLQRQRDMEKAVGLIAVGMSFPNHGQAVVFSGAAPIIGAFGFLFVGALIGGSRVAGRVGLGVLKVRPMQALSQRLASGSVVAALALAGAPVSMTQTIDGGLVGVGAALRASSVRWGIVRDARQLGVDAAACADRGPARCALAVRWLGLAP
jgi:PiT family inorganic phosphate transporter